MVSALVDGERKRLSNLSFHIDGFDMQMMELMQ